MVLLELLLLAMLIIGVGLIFWRMTTNYEARQRAEIKAEVVAELVPPVTTVEKKKPGR
jgi:hypothetical protein